MMLRAKAIEEGRGLIRVRSRRTGRLAAAGVCPGCWNSRARRPALLAELAARGFAVVHGADGATGIFLSAAHAPGCPWGLATKSAGYGVLAERVLPYRDAESAGYRDEVRKQ
jgi:hypothetical protein